MNRGSGTNRFQETFGIERNRIGRHLFADPLLFVNPELGRLDAKAPYLLYRPHFA